MGVGFSYPLQKTKLCRDGDGPPCFEPGSPTDPHSWCPQGSVVDLVMHAYLWIFHWPADIPAGNQVLMLACVLLVHTQGLPWEEAGHAGVLYGDETV